jgi:hypothetical protein
MLHHENLTLVVLAKPLEKLSQQWNEGAQVLQYLLMWKESMGFCRFVSGNAIKMADHISTAMSLSQKAFEKLPSHYHFAKLNTGHQEHYLNRLN